MLRSQNHDSNNKAVDPASENRSIGFIRNYAYLMLCFLNFAFIDGFFRYIYRNTANTEIVSTIPTLFSLAWILILLAIIMLLPGKLKKIFIVLLTVFYNVLVLVHCGLYSYNGSFFSFSDLMFADDGAAFFSLDYIFIRKVTLLAAVASIGVAVLSAVLAPKRTNYRLVVLIVSLTFLVVGVVTIRQVKEKWFGEYVSVSWNSYAQYSDLYESFTDSPSCMMLTGLYHYTFRDFWLSSGIDDLFSNTQEKVDAITEYCISRDAHPDNEMSGVLEGKNLIMVQLEAIDTWMLTQEAMPNLYRIKSQSVDFSNHYAPLYLSGGTFNTEIMANLGQIPPFYGSSTGVYAENHYPMSLAHLFSDAGYSVNSFHNSREEVYARGTIHLNWGYGKYHSGAAMGMPDCDFDSNLILGFDEMTANEPFYSFIITYSGHGPYENSSVSAAYYDHFAALHPDADSQYIHALAHAHETDLFIGALVAALENAGLADRTVLVFYSDHYNYYVLDDALVMKYKNVYDSNLIKNVPFFIHSSDLAPQTIKKVTSTMDILPTLANMFGFPVDLRFYAGDDAFSSGGGYVIFEDHAWYDGETYFVSGVSETSEFTDARNSEIAKRVYISNNVFLTDYFSHVDPALYFVGS